MPIRYFSFLLVLLIAFSAHGAMAASAVAVDPNSHKYGWVASETENEAVDGAKGACQKMTGSDCIVFSICGLPGKAAIAFNKSTGNWGAACGDPDQARADEHALETCNLRSQGKGQCDIVERFEDTFPGDAVSRPYFEGKWAQDCEASSWRQFRFVNAKEFRMQDCKAGGCTDRNEVFRPRDSENVFFWPTDNTRLFKRGPGLMSMVQINGVFLNRCEP